MGMFLMYIWPITNIVDVRNVTQHTDMKTNESHLKDMAKYSIDMYTCGSMSSCHVPLMQLLSYHTFDLRHQMVAGEAFHEICLASKRSWGGESHNVKDEKY